MMAGVAVVSKLSCRAGVVVRGTGVLADMGCLSAADNFVKVSWLSTCMFGAMCEVFFQE